MVPIQAKQHHRKTFPPYYYRGGTPRAGRGCLPAVPAGRSNRDWHERLPPKARHTLHITQRLSALQQLADLEIRIEVGPLRPGIGINAITPEPLAAHTPLAAKLHRHHLRLDTHLPKLRVPRRHDAELRMQQPHDV